jgi:hypothetical protein
MAIEIDFGRELGRLAFPDDITDEQAKSYVRDNYQAIRQGLLDRRRQELAAETESEEAAKFRAGEVGTLETVGAQAGALPRAFTEGTGLMLQGAERAAKFFPPPTVNPFTGRPIQQTVEPEGPGALTQAGRAIREFGAEAFPSLPGAEETIPAQVMGGVGSTLSVLPGALVGGLAAGPVGAAATIGSAIGAGALYGLQAGEAGAEDADRVINQRIAEALAAGDYDTASDLRSRAETLKNRAFLATAPIGAVTEGALGAAGKIPGMRSGAAGRSTLGKYSANLVERLIPQTASKRAQEMARGGIEGTVSEGLQESLEQTLGNMAAKSIYDPERGIMDGVAEAGFIGGASGGLVGGVIGSRRNVNLANSVVAANGADPKNPLPLSNATVTGIEDTTPTEGYSLEPEITEEDVRKRQEALGLKMPPDVTLPAPAGGGVIEVTGKIPTITPTPTPAPAPAPAPAPTPAAAPAAVSPETGLTTDEQDELDQLITAEDAGLLSEEGAITLAAYRARLGTEPAAIQTQPSQPSAVQEQVSGEGVLRREEPQPPVEVGLRQVDQGRGDAQGGGAEAEAQVQPLTVEETQEYNATIDALEGAPASDLLTPDELDRFETLANRVSELERAGWSFDEQAGWTAPGQAPAPAPAAVTPSPVIQAKLDPDNVVRDALQAAGNDPVKAAAMIVADLENITGRELRASYQEAVNRLQKMVQKPAPAPATKPVEQMTEQQYYLDRVEEIATANNISETEVRQYYTPENGREEYWQALQRAAEDGRQIIAKILDRLPEARIEFLRKQYPQALPQGYLAPGVRKTAGKEPTPSQINKVFQAIKANAVAVGKGLYQIEKLTPAQSLVLRTRFGGFRKNDQFVLQEKSQVTGIAFDRGFILRDKQEARTGEAARPAPAALAPAQPKAERKPRQESQQRLDAREFNRIAIDLAPDLNLIDDPAVLSPVFQGGLKDKGMIQADIARRQGIALVVRRLVQMLGGDPQKTSEADRAALLPKLRELAASTETNRKMQAFDAAIEAGGPVQLSSDSLAVGDTIVVGGSPLTITAVDPDTMAATADGGARYGEINIPAGIALAVDQYTPMAEETPAPAPAPVRAPRLGAGQNQGDLIASTQREDLRLVGEEGIDIEARQARAREAARQAAEARAAQRKAQTTMQLEAAPLPTVSQGTPAQQAAGTVAAAEAQGRELGPEPTGKPQTLEEATAEVRDAIGQLIESITPKAGFTGGPSASDSLKRLLREIPPAVLQSAALIAQRVYRETRDWAKATQAGIEEIFSRVKVADLEDTRAGFSEFIQGVNVPGSVPANPPQPAAGQERVDSRGYFTGQINPETVDNWQAESKRVIDSFGTDMEAAFRWAATTDMGADAREFVFKQIMERVFTQIARANNPIELARAEDLLRRVQSTWKSSGTQLGQAFAARAAAIDSIWYLHPLLAFRDLVRERQAQLPFPQFTSDQVRQWLQASGRQAIEELRIQMQNANNAFGREFRRITKDVLRREDINWADILTASDQRQGSMQYRLLEEILSQPGLRNLPPRGISEIVKLFSEAWGREQERIFRNEFRKQVPLPTVKKDDREKIFRSIPRILRYSNIAMIKDGAETRLLWDQAFRNAVAPQFGVAAIDGTTARKLTALAQKAQSAAGINRDEIVQQMFRLMQKEGGINWKDILRDYWYAAVLSGTRTQVDNALNIANGALNTAMFAGMAGTQGGKVLKAAGKGLSEAIKDFWPILWKGELYRSVSFNPDVPGNSLEGLQESRNLFLRGISQLKYVSRLMQALDHMTALMSDAASKAYTLAKTDPKLLEAYMLPSATTVANARARAIAEGTRPELVNRRTREIIEEALPVEVLLTARDIRQMSTFTETPQGLAGAIYQGVNAAERQLPGLKFLSGTSFVRFASNYANELLNYFAPVALWRWYQSAPGRQDTALGLKYSEARRDLLLSKLALGTALTGFAAALFLGDDDDEKKRAIDITGSFKSLSPEKRNQLLAEGRQPYSIRVGDTYISYRQLGFGGVLGAIGELRDQQLFSPEKYNKQSFPEKLIDGFVSGALIVKDSSAIAALTEFLGFANAYKYDVSQTIEKATPKYLSRLAGSVIPNIMKEADAWIDSSIYRAEPGNLGMEYFLQQVPFARQSIGPGPILNVLGEPVQVERYPYSRWLKFRKEDKAWNTLGQLASKGVFMPTPNITVTVKENGERRRMNRDEAYTYQKDVGQRYRTWIERNGDRLLKMKPDDAAEVIDKAADRMRADAREKIQQKVRR